MSAMLARYHRALVSTTLVAAALAAEASPGMLELRVDGKVKIKGGELNGARAIIVTDDAGTTSLADGLAHFTYALRLQTRYLFSFEQDGYTTKQVLFDTHVPVEHLAMAPFEFPFQVTLERTPEGRSLEYVGPVGFVRFMPEREDFGYDTDYRVKDDQPLFDRVSEFRIAELNLRQPFTTASTTAHLPAPGDALPAPIPATEVNEAGPRALNVLPPGPVKAAEVHRPAAEPVKVAVPVFLSAPMPAHITAPRPVSVAASSAAGIRYPARSAPATRATEVPTVSSFATKQMTAPILEDMREGRLIVEPTRVTTVVKIRQAGAQAEYRRVAHRFGPVFFFKNGQSCTARQYEVETELTGLPHE